MCRTDEQCIHDCLNGHPEVFRHLVSRHQSALLGYLRSRLCNAEEAAEAAQETFVRAYFALRGLNKLGSFFSWLVGIADRVVKETWRTKKRRQSFVYDERQIAETRSQSGDNPDTDVTDAVGRLPDVYREVVQMRYYGGLSCAEISRDLGMPIGTVTKSLSRAYVMLRECLQKENPQGNSEVKS